jgi:hypothetical protein
MMKPQPGNNANERQRDSVLDQFRRSLQLLAAEPQDQVAHFPIQFFSVSEEIALEFDNWAKAVPTFWELTSEQENRLFVLDEFLEEMSGEQNENLWTDQALFSDPHWNKVRLLAKKVLASFGWQKEVPPPAQYRNGMIIEE